MRSNSVSVRFSSSGGSSCRGRAGGAGSGEHEDQCCPPDPSMVVLEIVLLIHTHLWVERLPARAFTKAVDRRRCGRGGVLNKGRR